MPSGLAETLLRSLFLANPSTAEAFQDKMATDQRRQLSCTWPKVQRGVEGGQECSGSPWKSLEMLNPSWQQRWLQVPEMPPWQEDDEVGRY